MSGKKESLLEEILKPVRINPVVLGISLTGWWLTYILNDSDNVIGKVANYVSTFCGGIFLGFYLYSITDYFRDRKLIRDHGFDERHGKLRMGHYCSRQAFYVASIENGYRDEARTLIAKTPKEEKAFPFFPHI